MKRLETEQLILRGWEEGDELDFFEIAKSEKVKQAGWQPHSSLEETKDWIRLMIQCQDSWAIVLKENNKVIGWIELAEIRRYKRYRELEYIVGENYQNKGYATEAVKGVLDYAFRTLDLMVVAVCHYPDNLRSKRVIEKCGFTYEGTLRKYSRNLKDSVRYSMIKEEWESLDTYKEKLHKKV